MKGGISLGYTLYDKVLNAIDYGVLQTRRRYFLVVILDKNEEFVLLKINDALKHY